MSDAPNHCDHCHADYFYSPASHRCPGEWEAECARLARHPWHPLTSQSHGLTSAYGASGRRSARNGRSVAPESSTTPRRVHRLASVAPKRPGAVVAAPGATTDRTRSD